MPSVVPLSDVCEAAVQDLHSRLAELAERLSPPVADAEKRRMIRAYLAYARSLLLRLLVIARWSKEGGISPRDWETLGAAEESSNLLRRAADSLYFVHEELPRSCAPPYDVRAAMEVLGTGRYTQLPRALQAPAPRAPPSQQATSAALHWLRGVLRVRRAAWKLPHGMRLRETRGCVVCHVAGEYEMALSAQPQPEAPWRLLRLHHLVGADASAGSTSRWERLKASLQAKLDALPAQPLLELHEEVHSACCTMALHTLHSQAVGLMRGQWSGRLKAELQQAADGAAAALRLTYTFHAPAAGVKRPRSEAEAPPLSPGQAVLEVVPGEPCGMRVSHVPQLWHAPDPTAAAAAAAAAADADADADADTDDGSLHAVRMESLSAEALLVRALRARSVTRLQQVRRLVGSALQIDEAAAVPTLRISAVLALGAQPRDGKLVQLGAPTDVSLLASESSEAMTAMVRILRRREAVQHAAFAIGAVPKPSPSFAVSPPATPAAAPAAAAEGKAAPAAAAAEGKAAAAPAAAAEGKAALATAAFAKLGGVGGTEWKPLELTGMRQRQLAELWLELPWLMGWHLQVRFATSEALVVTDFWLVHSTLTTSDGRKQTPLPKRAVRLPTVRPKVPPCQRDEASEALLEMQAVCAHALTIGTQAEFQLQLEAAELKAEVTSENTLQVAPLPASACCPPLPEGMLGPHLRVAPLIVALPGGGWQATVPLMEAPKCTGCIFGSECPSGAQMSFDEAGCHLRYLSLTPTSLHRLLLDLQSLAMVRAMLLRLEEFRAGGAPGMAGLRVLSASSKGLLLLTQTRKRVSLVCGGSEGTRASILQDVAATRPLLQMRLRIDGRVPPGEAQAALAAMLRTASVFDLLTCEALAPMGVLC
ncbi:hypothetical protein AB1Y20_017801 [Prymnesium parvum]|uniref:Mediator of RNA polymerase II transcription subunit 14 n=1 Tax=Prymnesium parvum TaxID=97485 RepID=A0AB34JQ10_PRYPA